VLALVISAFFFYEYTLFFMFLMLNAPRFSVGLAARAEKV